VLGFNPPKRGESWYVPPLILYSQPETVFSVMLVTVCDNLVGAAGAVWVAFVTVAVGGELTSPVQLAAVTVTVTKQFKQCVTASILYDDVFYKTIIQSWYNEFKTIQKLKNQNFMIDNVTTPKEAQAALFAYLLQEAGQNLVTDFLNELKAKKVFPDRKYYTRVKADLNKIIVAKNGNTADLIQELEKKIFTTAKYAL